MKNEISSDRNGVACQLAFIWSADSGLLDSVGIPSNAGLDLEILGFGLDL